MAIKVGTNDLKTFRYHGARCSRGLKGEWTYQPQTPEEKKDDTCECPIWAYGYLAKETRNVNGKLKAKRVNPMSLGATEWATATQRVARLYELGKIPRPSPEAHEGIDGGVTTVRHAVKEFLAENLFEQKEGNIQEVTYRQYERFVNDRLVPWCADNGITKVKDFERAPVCQSFQRSWINLRAVNSDKKLAKAYRKLLTDIFRIFLRFCLRSEFIEKEGTHIYRSKRRRTKDKSVDGDEEGKRYGLELAEFARMMAAPDSPRLTPQENQECKAAAGLMRYVGLRTCDCYKFNSSEVVPNDSGNGYNANFIQQKNSNRCISPIPNHSGVLEMLNALPGRTVGRNKYFFTGTLVELRQRVRGLAQRAQKDGRGPFAHHFSPHCLRHTFAIQLLNQGVDIRLISKWLGHSTDVVTRRHYQHWIKSTNMMAEQASQEAVDRMLEEPAAATMNLKLEAQIRQAEATGRTDLAKLLTQAREAAKVILGEDWQSA